jgi:hypothetical protein
LPVGQSRKEKKKKITGISENTFENTGVYFPSFFSFGPKDRVSLRILVVCFFCTYSFTVGDVQKKRERFKKRERERNNPECFSPYLLALIASFPWIYVQEEGLFPPFLASWTSAAPEPWLETTSSYRNPRKEADKNKILPIYVAPSGFDLSA